MKIQKTVNAASYQTQNKNEPNFKGRKVALAKPIINGIEKEIEIFSIGKRDAVFLQKTVGEINLDKLIPEHAGKMSQNVWQGLINLAAEEIGQFSKQKCFLAVSDKKPCGIIVTNKNKSKGTLSVIASIPTGVNEQVKGAGSSLITAFLDMAKSKKLKKLTLEPVLYGPTDTVAFYEKHNFRMANPNDSVSMFMTSDLIKKTFDTNKKSLNYKQLKHPVEFNLANYLDTSKLKS